METVFHIPKTFIFVADLELLKISVHANPSK